MNKTTIEETKAARPKEPLAYAEACRRYAEWAEKESANVVGIVAGVPIPNCGLSEVVGSTWRLRNVCGPLASVGWNGRVWAPRKEAD